MPGLDEVAATLSSFRRLRLGRLALSAAPPQLASMLADGGLGAACEGLSAWAARSITSVRSAEAVDRYFGLTQLPQEQGAVARGLLKRRIDVEGVLGPSTVTIRQVQHLIRHGIAEMAAHPEMDGAVSRTQSSDEVGSLWFDPFPGNWRAPDRVQFRALLWAWAQVPDPGHAGATSLLHYEHEHGLRPEGPQPTSRMERQRWRRVAWSALLVGAFRARVVAGPYDPSALFLTERTVRPRRSDSRSGAAAGLLRPDQLGPLGSLLAYPPELVPIELVRDVVESARHAVRERMAEASQVVALLGEAITRIRLCQPRVEIPADITTKLLALNTILAKEDCDLAGVATADGIITQSERLLGDEAVRTSEAGAVVISDTLRTSQELAELANGLDLPGLAWNSVRRFRACLTGNGDPEDEREPSGWLNQLCVTTARVERGMAVHSRRPDVWLRRAADHARLSADIVLDGRALPAWWGVEGLVAEINVRLDMAELAGGAAGAAKALRMAERVATEARMELESIGPVDGMEYQLVRFGLWLALWRLALFIGDPHAVEEAQRRTMTQAEAWIRPHEMRQVSDLDAATARFFSS